MRIALVADGAVPAEGDCSRDPHVVADGLRDLGHEVTLYVLADTGSSASDGEHTGGRSSPGSEPEERMSPHPAATWWSLTGLAPKPEAVLSMGMAAPVPSAILADSLGVPLVLCLPANLFGPAPPAPGYRRLVCRHLPAHCLLVESDRHARAAVRHGADRHRVFVVPPGIRLETSVGPAERGRRTTTSPARDRLRVFFDASATPLDDQRFVASLLDRVRAERRRRVHTVVFAPGDRPGETGDLWSGGDITLVRDRGELPARYADSDVVVVPSATVDETLPALRALAAGRPLLAADCPQNRDVVRSVRHGVLAQPGRPDEWLDKLDYLLAEAPVRVHLGRGARAHVESSFALPQALSQTEERLRSVTAAWCYAPTSDPWTQGEET
ncbi:glycosyltransferase family 4 protein [Streptomyces sp. B6B3]|uniref:glycosyltransferase family 4 protein n=1 Tax=Streptomyces sp. B6B3 TaxID=3153570 RepID=UPI00325C789C